MDLVTALRLGLNSASPDVVSLTGGGGKTSTLRRLADEIAMRGGRVVFTTTTRVSAYQVKSAPALAWMESSDLPATQISKRLDTYGQCMVVSHRHVDGHDVKYSGLSIQQVEDLAAKAARLDVSAIIVEADGSRLLPFKAPAKHEPPVPACTTVLVPIAGIDALGRFLDERSVHRPQLVKQLLNRLPNETMRLSARMLATVLAHPLGGAKHRPDGAYMVALLNKVERYSEVACGRLVANELAKSSIPSLLGSTGIWERPPVRERWGPIVAVILAAGSSRRLGQPKQLVELKGEPLVVRTARKAVDGGVTETIVVTGAHADEVRRALITPASEPSLVVRTTHNPQWETGQASSLRAGLRALPDSVEAALFLPVDQPLLPSTLLRRMLARWREGFSIVAPRVNGDVRGAPCLFDRRHWNELASLEGDVGGRAVLKRHKDQVAPVDVAATLLTDIDVPADIEHARRDNSPDA